MEESHAEEAPCLFLNLPVEIISKIFSYTSYEHIGKMRSVCKVFNDIGSSTLNTTFSRLQNVVQTRYHQIKSQMPRRESSRRNHPLAREWDIIETVHMRLTLLEMTFGKHIERRNCCFFAGEILDEVYRIYRYVISCTNLGRAYRVTDELFELTTMATEYFREYIEPNLPDIVYFSSDFLDCTTACSWKSPYSSTSRASSISWASSSTDDKLLTPPSPNGALKKRIKRLRQGMKRNNSRLAFFKRELKSSASQMGDQQRQLIEYNARLDDYDKKFEENARKFRCVFQELNKCKTELQFWRSKSPANQLCYNCSSSASFVAPAETQSNNPIVEKAEPQPNSNEDEDLSRYFISESKQESPAPKIHLRMNEFIPIAAKEDESCQAGCSTSKAGIKREMELSETEDDVKERNECDKAAKRCKTALVKRLLE